MTQIDADRHKVFLTLQREADNIADSASRELFDSWSSTIRDMARGGAPVDSSRVLSMIKDGFVRLGGVVRFAVLVDEPGVIADDMQWLKRAFGARRFRFGDKDWDTKLLQVFAGCSKPHLDEAQYEMLRELIERAIAHVSDDKEPEDM